MLIEPFQGIQTLSCSILTESQCLILERQDYTSLKFSAQLLSSGWTSVKYRCTEIYWFWKAYICKYIWVSDSQTNAQPNDELSSSCFATWPVCLLWASSNWPSDSLCVLISNYPETTRAPDETTASLPVARLMVSSGLPPHRVSWRANKIDS